MQAKYIQGESITVSVPDAGYSAVVVRVGAGVSSDAALADGKWSATISSGSLSGLVRYAVLATTADGRVAAVDSGSFFVCVMVSKYREVVEAIETAIQKNATNGKYSITVGEISLTDKTFDEMVSFAEYYKGLAENDETGETTTGRVTTIQSRFG